MPVAEKEAALNADPELAEAKTAVENQWQVYYSCFTDDARKYRNFKYIYEIATGARVAGQNRDVTFADGYNADNVLEILEELQRLTAALRKLHKVKSRHLTTEYLRNRTKQDTEGKMPGTSAQRDAALEKSAQVSSFLQPIIQETAAKATANAPSDRITDTEDTVTTTTDTTSPAISENDDDDTDGITLGDFARPEYSSSMFTTLHLLDTECPPTSMLEDDMNAGEFVPAEKDINEEEEPNECPLSVTEVRAGVMAALMEPIEADREIAKHYDQATKRWTCPRCKLYTHDPEMRNGKTFDKDPHFRRHV
ncbi:uncharacterized protein EV420DRAFT_589676 [Desarmillaria tabescens]|uniref:Uncharacterized protein n=1 Tax=Armillaria tabescens TaxID=1929756 RepID=A0AA39N2N1_ARMTA|nr:uncharacterized protein EV420DRAFT_589676 [Desarmillaria tabescens]KAK0455238.1 hypothetical protein EV420DRAFT_589676 [Desarmillaria tabescens]